MFLCGEMAAAHAQIADEQEDCADDHVHPVETRCKEEGREELIPAECPVFVNQQFPVFIGLKRRKEQAQHNTDQKAPFDILAAFIVHQRVVRPSHRRARQKQHQRVDQRQVPDIHLIETWLHILRPDIFIHRVNRVFKERPEPCDKEHGFGHDEHDKAIAQADPHNGGVIALVAFRDHIRPPAEHHVKDGHKAHQEHPRARTVHPQHAARKHYKSPNGSNQRPERGRNDMIIMVLCMGHLFWSFAFGHSVVPLRAARSSVISIT